MKKFLKTVGHGAISSAAFAVRASTMVLGVAIAVPAAVVAIPSMALLGGGLALTTIAPRIRLAGLHARLDGVDPAVQPKVDLTPALATMGAPEMQILETYRTIRGTAASEPATVTEAPPATEAAPAPA